MVSLIYYTHSVGMDINRKMVEKGKMMNIFYFQNIVFNALENKWLVKDQSSLGKAFTIKYTLFYPYTYIHVFGLIIQRFK